MSNELIKVDDNKKSIIESNEPIKDDFEYARNNLYNVIDKATNSLQQMIDIAYQSQHPAAYEVLNNMFKNISQLNKDLVDLQKKKNDLLKTSSANAPAEQSKQITNNNLFVGSTDDLNKMIEDRMKTVNDSR